MKVIYRARDEFPNRTIDDPIWMRWSEWEETSDEGLSTAECEGLIMGSIETPDIRLVWIGPTVKINTAHRQEEFKIVEDGYDVDDLNERIKQDQ